MYIDPNDPQAAALLQQAGLTITEDGTVIGGIDEASVQQQVEGEVITPEQAENQLGSMMEGTDDASTGVPQELFMSAEDVIDSKENLNLDAVQVSATDPQPASIELGTALVRISKILIEFKITLEIHKSVDLKLF